MCIEQYREIVKSTQLVNAISGKQRVHCDRPSIPQRKIKGKTCRPRLLINLTFRNALCVWLWLFYQMSIPIMSHPGACFTKLQVL